MLDSAIDLNGTTTGTTKYDYSNWNLISPIAVGSDLYYVVDTNNSLTHTTADTVTHAALDTVFNNNNDTTDIVRTAVLGIVGGGQVLVALPKVDSNAITAALATSTTYAAGTYSAIWDQVATAGNGTNGLPMGWGDSATSTTATPSFWSATLAASASNHYAVTMDSNVKAASVADGTSNYFALQVLDEITSPNTAKVAEQRFDATLGSYDPVVYTATGMSAVGDGTLKWSLAGTGADNNSFTINSTDGTVHFSSAMISQYLPNYEDPNNTDHAYNITVRGTDSLGGSLDQSVTISVTDVNEYAPKITNTVFKAIVAENSSGTVYDINGSDQDGTAILTYSVSGTDAARFNVNASTGVVSFKIAPNFESPTDTDKNNVYDFNVLVSDGTNVSQPSAVQVAVTNVNEAPVLTNVLSSYTFNEGTGLTTATTLFDANAIDPDGTAITWSLTGVDATKFTIDTNGIVKFANASYAGSTLPFDLNYNFTVVAKDATGLSSSAATAVNVSVDNKTISLAGSALGGQLMNPVMVEGKVYYIWDQNGNGVIDDQLGHQILDPVFQYDQYGNREASYNRVGILGETDNTYRWATISGHQMAVPTYGSTVDGLGYADKTSTLSSSNVWSFYYFYGTGVSVDAPGYSPAANYSPYDDLLAIWDAYNGTGTGTDTVSSPPGWFSGIHSATPAHTFAESGFTNPDPDGHVFMAGGLSQPGQDGRDYRFIVFQVI